MTSIPASRPNPRRLIAAASMLGLLLCVAASSAETPKPEHSVQVSPDELNDALRLARTLAAQDSRSEAAVQMRTRLDAAGATLERWVALSHTTPASRSEALAAAALARLGAVNTSRAILNARRSLLNDPLNPRALAALAQARVQLAQSISQPPPDASESATAPVAPAQRLGLSAQNPMSASYPQFDGTPKFAHTTRSVLARLPTAVLPAATLLLLLAASVFAGVRLSFGSRPARSSAFRLTFTPALLLALLGGGMCTLAAFSLWPQITCRDAIVTAQGATASAAPTYDSRDLTSSISLAPGTELRVLESSIDRAERWFRVWNTQSPASAPFWIPADAVEPVIPQSWAWRWIDRSPGA